MEEKMDKLDIKIKNFSFVRDTNKLLKRNHKLEGNISTHIPDKRLISGIKNSQNSAVTNKQLQ